jgi:glycosyltransferase involved in cell wall biosynthesis
MRAVQSALKQDWPNKEIVIVDDASTDSSLAALEEIGQKFPDIIIVRHQTNKGYAGALNTIIKSARGEFVAIFDDDDVSRPDRLTKQFQRLIDYERLHSAQLALCYSNRNVVRVGQTEPDHVAMAIGREAPEPSGPMVADYLFGHLVDSHHVWGMFGSCTLMARREVFLEVGNFDENFRRCAEWDLAVRAAFRGAAFIAVNEPLITQYKTRSAEKSGNIPLVYAVLLRKKHKEYLQKEKVYLASIAIAHARFNGSKRRFWKSRFYNAMAYALLPSAILTAKLRSRVARGSSIESS